GCHPAGRFPIDKMQGSGIAAQQDAKTLPSLSSLDAHSSADSGLQPGRKPSFCTCHGSHPASFGAKPGVVSAAGVFPGVASASSLASSVAAKQFAQQPDAELPKLLQLLAVKCTVYK